MKKEFIEPNIEIVEVEDIITASINCTFDPYSFLGEDNDEEWFSL